MRLICGALILDQLEAPFGNGVAADLHIGGAGRGQRQVELDQALAAGRLRRHGLRLRAIFGAGDEAHAFALRRIGPDDQLAPFGDGQRAEGSRRPRPPARCRRRARSARSRYRPAASPRHRGEAAPRRCAGAGVKAAVRRSHRLGPAASAATIRTSRSAARMRVRILAVGPRVRPARLELRHQPAEPLAMRRPEQRRVAARRGAEPVFIGGGRPVLDVGVPLQPPERLGPRRQAQANERQEGGEQREAESPEQDAVGERRQQGPRARAATR